MKVLDQQAVIVLENIQKLEARQVKTKDMNDTFWRRLTLASMARASKEARR